MKKIRVTTSWDDGLLLDRKIAVLLLKFGLKGTFYVSPNNREFPKNKLLTRTDIVSLSKNFEIGAHTLTHPALTEINADEAKKEIIKSKRYLEKITKKNIKSFCYPKGKYNPDIRDMVSDSGFIYARTVKRFGFKLPNNLFESETSIDCYKHYQDVVKIFNFSHWKFGEFWENMDWEILAKRTFNRLSGGDVYHLWGHSWIIDKNNEWEKLERVLSYISRRNNIIYCENKDLAK